MWSWFRFLNYFLNFADCVFFLKILPENQNFYKEGSEKFNFKQESNTNIKY